MAASADVVAADGGVRKRRPLPRSSEEKIAEGQRLKSKGNDYFKRGQFKKAAYRYHKVFLFVNGLTASDENMAQYAGSHVLSKEASLEVKELKASVHNNLAMTFLKQSKGAEALDAADKCLAIQPSNFKAKFRRAQAFTLLRDFDRANAVLLELRDVTSAGGSDAEAEGDKLA